MTEEQYEKLYKQLNRQSKFLEEASKNFELMLNNKGVIYHKNEGFLKSLMLSDSLNQIVKLYIVYLDDGAEQAQGYISKPIQLYIFLSGQDSLSKSPICPGGYMKAYVGDVVRGSLAQNDRKSLYVSYSSREKRYLVKPMTFLRSYNQAYIDKSLRTNKTHVKAFKHGLVWIRLSPKKIEKEDVLFNRFSAFDHQDENSDFPYIISHSIQINIGKDFLVPEEQFLGLFDLAHYDNFWKLKMKIKLKEMETLFGEESFYV